MRLRGFDFRPVANASGAQGFFGEGYPFHHYWKLAGLTFQGCTFVAKTTTMEPRLDPTRKLGNMPLKADGITPREFKPACIVVQPRTGVTLNAVGLSGPGAPSLFSRYLWQQRREPFFISFMSLQPTASDRLAELSAFICSVSCCQSDFASPFGLELNLSCPNVGLDPSHLIDEAGQMLDIAARLAIPVQVKLNTLAPPRAACEIAAHEACDAIVMGNTLPWGSLPSRIDWPKLFDSGTSPLAHLGGGGLSGPLLAPIHCDWIRDARDCGIAKPIWGCGGIFSQEDVFDYAAAGAAGVQLGTVAIMRPWRMRSLIRYASEMYASLFPLFHPRSVPCR